MLAHPNWLQKEEQVCAAAEQGQLIEKGMDEDELDDGGAGEDEQDGDMAGENEGGSIFEP